MIARLTLIGALLLVAPDRLVVSGLEYGRSQSFEGSYFSNFEVSAFTLCERPAGQCDKDHLQSFWLECVPDACRALENRAKALGVNIYESGRLRIRFIGRRSSHASPLRFMHDRPNKILVEKVLDVALP